MERTQLPNQNLLYQIVNGDTMDDIRDNGGVYWLPNGNLLRDYHWSYTDLLETGFLTSSTSEGDLTAEGAFSGTLDVGSSSSTSTATGGGLSQTGGGTWTEQSQSHSLSGTLGQHTLQSSSSGSYNESTHKITFPSQTITSQTVSLTGYWGASGTISFPTFSLQWPTITTSHGAYSIDGSKLATDYTGSLRSSSSGSGSSSGTIEHPDYATNDVVMLDLAGDGVVIPSAGTNDDGFYLFVGYRMWGRNASNELLFYKGQGIDLLSKMVPVWRDSVRAKPFTWSYSGIYVIDSSGVGHLLRTPSEGYVTLPYSVSQLAFVFRGNAGNLGNANNSRLFMERPVSYLLDFDAERTITTQTQMQTQELKDTTGSNTLVGNAQSQFDAQIRSKLGFVSQTADIAHGIYDAMLYEGDGTVPFPGVSWDGMTIIAAQDVPILGWMPDIEDDVKTGVTLVLFLAWLHGIHSLYARMFLGETMVEVDDS